MKKKFTVSVVFSVDSDCSSPSESFSFFLVSRLLSGEFMTSSVTGRNFKLHYFLEYRKGIFFESKILYIQHNSTYHN